MHPTTIQVDLLVCVGPSSSTCCFAFLMCMEGCSVTHSNEQQSEQISALLISCISSISITARCSVAPYPRIPFISFSEASLSFCMMVLYSAPLLSLTVRSTTDTSEVGTRKAIPVSLPFSSGSTCNTTALLSLITGMQRLLGVMSCYVPQVTLAPVDVL